MVAYIVQIVSMITTTMFNFYTGLDTIYIDYPDNNISVLDAYIAIIFFDIVLWFFGRILNMDYDSGESFESEGAKYQQYGETGYTSAEEIDFSDEIVHENP